MLTASVGQPNGLATLDANGKLNQTINSVNGVGTIAINTPFSIPFNGMVNVNMTLVFGYIPIANGSNISVGLWHDSTTSFYMGIKNNSAKAIYVWRSTYFNEFNANSEIPSSIISSMSGGFSLGGLGDQGGTNIRTLLIMHEEGIVFLKFTATWSGTGANRLLSGNITGSLLRLNAS